MWPVWYPEEEPEVTPATPKIVAMALTDTTQPPACSRCDAPNAGFRIEMKPVCAACLSWLDHIRLVNRGVFDAKD